MKILISIVSHDQQTLVHSLMRSFDRFLMSDKHDVIVVITENKITQNNVTSERFELVKITNLRQKGFGANHNTVFENFESDVFFIVNPDILLGQNFDLDLLVDFLEEKKVDIASPVILNSSGFSEDNKRSDLTLKNLLKRKVLKIKDNRFEWLAGMFLIVRSKSFRTLRGFDIDYFMYVEDCDLSMRARKLRMNLSYLEAFSVIHDARRASTKNLKHLKWHIASLLRYWFLK